VCPDDLSRSAAAAGQLEAIEIERLRLEARLHAIESEREPSPPASLAAIVTNESLAADKIALFRRLFAGGTDVFAARWENPKSGRSGYAQLARTSGCAVFAVSRRFVAASAPTSRSFLSPTR
jgi:hypothetical protein